MRVLRSFTAGFAALLLATGGAHANVCERQDSAEDIATDTFVFNSDNTVTHTKGFPEYGETDALPSEVYTWTCNSDGWRGCRHKLEGGGAGHVSFTNYNGQAYISVVYLRRGWFGRTDRWEENYPVRCNFRLPFHKTVTTN